MLMLKDYNAMRTILVRMRKPTVTYLLLPFKTTGFILSREVNPESL
jgi:hypothetical protein